MEELKKVDSSSLDIVSTRRVTKDELKREKGMLQMQMDNLQMQRDMMKGQIDSLKVEIEAANNKLNIIEK